MTNTQTVRKAMGLVQFQFFDFINGHYKYTNSDKYFKMQSKWKKHVPNLRGRQQAIVLTVSKEANSKSGCSYDILGVFCILESHAELEHFNAEYWNAIKYKTTDKDKLLATAEFAEETIQVMLENGREFHHNKETHAILKVLATAAQETKQNTSKAAKPALTF